MLATIYEREIPTANKCTKEHGYREKLLIWILKLYCAFAVPVSIDVQPRPQDAFPWLWPRWAPPKPGKSALGTRLVDVIVVTSHSINLQIS